MLRLGTAIALFVSVPGFAWDKHQELQKAFFESPPEELRAALNEELAWTDDWLIASGSLVESLKLNADAVSRLARSELRKPIDILFSPAIDEPDQGMDRDLPDSMDPKEFRRWMGGKTGPTSQGFRHMFFGGFQWDHPMATFQLPFHAIGEAPARFTQIAQHAKLMKTEKSAIHGWRVLAWALHYIQDLAQPFHSTQVPSLGMVPWSVVFQWPPEKGFDALVNEATRTLSNYHWAYEGWVMHEFGKPNSALRDCVLKSAPSHSYNRVDSLNAIVAGVLKLSRHHAGALGRSIMEYFGTGLMEKSMDLPQGIGRVDYEWLDKNESLSPARTALVKTTCDCLSSAKSATLNAVRWFVGQE